MLCELGSEFIVPCRLALLGNYIQLSLFSSIVYWQGYEVFCNNLYSNTIQEERQRILKFFGIKRNIIGHLNVQDDTKFIDILEQRKIISTANVDQLLECLNMLGLEKLTEITIGYKSAIATGECKQHCLICILNGHMYHYVK